MKVAIEIPKEFEDHFNHNRFQDSLRRIAYDLQGVYKTHFPPTATSWVSGNYEVETIEMLINAFENADIVG